MTETRYSEYERVLSARLAWERASDIYNFQSAAIAKLLIEKRIITQKEFDRAIKEQEQIFDCDRKFNWDNLPETIKKRWLRSEDGKD